MRTTASAGNIEEIKISENLIYCEALKVLVKDLIGVGITIDIESFYTIKTVELHDFINTLTYRFIEEKNEKLLIYCLCSRPNEIYKEVKFDGEVVFSNLQDIELGIGSNKPTQMRRKRYLGV